MPDTFGLHSVHCSIWNSPFAVRHFTSVSFSAIALLLCFLPLGSSLAVEKPNIVVILADDMGYGDVQVLNDKSKIKTPSLNQLAKQGMTFTNAHTPSSVCTPTRYGLLTGRYCW